MQHCDVCDNGPLQSDFLFCPWCGEALHPPEKRPAIRPQAPGSRIVRTCRACGCTDSDCGGCVERTGAPCHWVETNLCSACT